MTGTQFTINHYLKRFNFYYLHPHPKEKLGAIIIFPHNSMKQTIFLESKYETKLIKE